MRLFSLLTAIVALSVSHLAVQAQVQQPQAPTTVQLPTFSVFTVQTTVTVPDSGAGFLGGIGRARDGSTTRGFGPLKNRGLASSRGASGMSVHARIIDHHEMDEAVLAEAAAKRGSSVAAGIAGRAANGTPIESVAAIREQHASSASLKAREALEYFAKAQQAEAKGNAGLAKIYYQMVIRRDTSSLKEQAQTRLAALTGGKAAAVATR